MAVIVSIAGVVTAAIGLSGLIQPNVLVRAIGKWHGPGRYWTAIIMRLVMGVVLLVAAPSCRLPMAVRVIGCIAIVAALTLLIVGETRLDSFIHWWLARPLLVRVSALFATGFGALLIYAGA